MTQFVVEEWQIWTKHGRKLKQNALRGEKIAKCGVRKYYVRSNVKSGAVCSSSIACTGTV